MAVGVVEGVGHFAGNPDGVIDTQLLFALQPVTQALALDERHHAEDHPVRRAGVVQRQDMGVLQDGGGLDLLQEPVGTEDGGQLRTRSTLRATVRSWRTSWAR